MPPIIDLAYKACHKTKRVEKHCYRGLVVSLVKCSLSPKAKKHSKVFFSLSKPVIPSLALLVKTFPHTHTHTQTLTHTHTHTHTHIHTHTFKHKQTQTQTLLSYIVL